MQFILNNEFWRTVLSVDTKNSASLVFPGDLGEFVNRPHNQRWR